MKTQEKIATGNNVMVQSLNGFLADMQVFYQNLRGMHWNVEGPLFFQLHEKFEEFYNKTADQIDEVAERIRMYDQEPLHAFSDYLSVAELEEIKHVSDGRKAAGYVLQQSDDLLTKMNQILAKANASDDEATSALFSDLIRDFEKRNWMLRSFLK